MNVKFLNPFLQAAIEVLKAETDLNLERGELCLEKSSYQTDDVTTIISLVGNVEGNVFYSMSTQTAVGLASQMLGERLDEFDNLAQSGIAELGNVITGRASVLLSEAGFEATISPPTLLIGKGSTISTLDFPRLVVPFHISFGTLMIHLALREGNAKKIKTAQIPIPNRPSF
ncbi:MAG: chemotaxis protein CheX [Chloroflexi bacterium]|nr:chemotaxis protein CheX [Anaerolineaceae bacterium]NMB86830.1 chemotaxis protein CheX [Chloroflexota bacterium]